MGYVWIAEFDDSYFDSGGVSVVGVFGSPVDAMVYCDNEFDFDHRWHVVTHDGDYATFTTYTQGNRPWDDYEIRIYQVPVGGEI